MFNALACSAGIENGTVKIVPDVLVTGGGNATDGLMGMLTKLLLWIDLNVLMKRQVAEAPETRIVE